MATLSGNKIKNTYQSLVKFSDNGNITTSAKQLTDGFGNNSPMFVSTTQVGIGVTPESGIELHVYGDAKIGSNLTVIGNLVVEGSTTTVGTDTLTVKDPLIVLANNNTSTDAVDIGFYGKYTPSGTTLYSGLFREALTGKYRLFKDLQTEPTTTVNTGGTGYAVASLVANLEGNVAGGTISGTTGSFSDNIVISNDSTPSLQLLDTNNNVNLYLYASDIEAGIGTYSAHPLKFVQNTGTALTIDTSKNATFEGNIILAGTVDGRNVSTDGAKLDGIEAGADVTDTANVTLAGALMDSELTDLAGIKAVTISTLQVKPSEGAFVNGDKTKLDGIEAGATTDQTAAEIKTAYESNSNTNAFTDADETKLDGIEASADVTDATNVLAAGAVMTSGNQSIAGVKTFSNQVSIPATPSASTDAASKGYVDTKTGENNELSEVLSNGNTTGGTDIAVSAGDDITFTDTSKALFGAGNDLEIYHNGTNSVIDNNTNNLLISTASQTIISSDATDNQLTLGHTSGNWFAKATNSNTLVIGSESNATNNITLDTSNGGSATFAGDVSLLDNKKLKFGAGNDLEIYHNGSNSFIDEAGTGSLFLRADATIEIKSLAQDEYYIKCVENDTVELYFDGTKRLETVTDGAKVTGNLEVAGNVGVNGFITHNGDSGTFMGWSADDTNVFYTAGNERLRIDSSGNVGIGTETPYAFDTTATKLHVKNDAGAGNIAEVARFQGSADASGSAAVIRLGTSNDRGMYIQAGRTGAVPYGAIGTTEYDGTKTETIFINSDKTVEFKGAATFAGNVTANGVYSSGQSAIIYKAQRNGGAVAGDWSYDDATTDMSLGTSTSHSFSLKTGNTRAFTIDTSQNATFAGDVSSSGTSKSLKYWRRLWTDANNDWGLNNNAGTGVISVSGMGTPSTSTTTFAGDVHLSDTILGLRSTNDYAIQYRDLDFRLIGSADGTTQRKFSFGYYTSDNPAGTWNGKVYINSYSGDVGIGTTSPSSDISGSVTMLEINDATNNNLASLALKAGTQGSKWEMAAQSSNALGFFDDGSERMRIDSSGRVGIGTTSPQRTLHVNGTEGVLRLTSTASGNNGFEVGIGVSSQAFLWLAENSHMEFATNNVERMRLHSDGNVTIGNTASVQPLTVAGNVLFRTTTADSFENRFQFIVGGASDAGNFYVYDAAESAKIRLNGGGDSYFNGGNVGIGTTSPESLLHIKGETRAYITFQDTSDGYIGFIGDAPNMLTGGTVDNLGLRGEGGIQFGVSDVIKMVLDSSGKVGIGTTSPSATLDLGNNGGQKFYVYASGSVRSGMGIDLSGSARELSIFHTSSNNIDGDISLGLRNETSGQYVERMRIQGNGNVGIGTTSPDAKLDVSTGTTTDIIRFGPASRWGFSRANSDSRYVSFMRNQNVSGTAVWTVDGDNGNVGIGTTSPQNILHLKSDDPKLILEDGNAGTDEKVYAIYPAGSQYVLQTMTDAHVSAQNAYVVDRTGTTVDGQKWYINNSEALVLDSIGNVGIGTTSPSAKLKVIGANDSWACQIENTQALPYGLSVNTIGTAGTTFNSAFYTTTGTGMYIVNNGKVGIGLTSPQSKLHIGESATVGSNFTTAVNNSQLFVHNVGANTNSNVIFAGGDTGASGGTGAYSFGQNGQGYTHWIFYHKPISTNQSSVGSISSTSTATAYNTSSDYRLKENVVEMTGALNRVSELKPSRFNFIEDEDKTVDGFLAHEVQDIVPEAITGEKDAVDEDGNAIYQGIDQSKLVPLLVGAIQELKAEIELLKTQINK